MGEVYTLPVYSGPTTSITTYPTKVYKNNISENELALYNYAKSTPVIATFTELNMYLVGFSANMIAGFYNGGFWVNGNVSAGSPPYARIDDYEEYILFLGFTASLPANSTYNYDYTQSFTEKLYQSSQEAYQAVIGAYPITYRLTNCTAPDAPTEAAVGDSVSVSFVFTEGYGITDNANVYVTNNGVIVPSTYSDGVLTFEMPDSN